MRPANGLSHRRWRALRKCPGLPLLTLVAVSASACVYLMALAAIFEAEWHNVPVEIVPLLNFSFPISPCKTPVYALLLVGSHPDHRHVRDVLRRHWGQPNISGRPFRIIFLFGKLPKSEQQMALEFENGLHGDILQGDFLDSYHNVTVRDLMGLHWAATNCPDAQFVVRADDDIAMDIDYLVQLLDKQQFAGRKELLACFNVVVGAQPLRYGRYGVARRDFSGHTYAPYCQGWMYVLTPTTAGKLVETAGRVPPMWINDVYITGELANALGQERELLGISYTDEYRDMAGQARRGFEPGRDLFRVGPTRAEANLTESLQDLFRIAAQNKSPLTSEPWAPFSV